MTTRTTDLTSLPEAIFETVKVQGDALALVDPPQAGGKTYTYQQFGAAINSLASWLIEEGVAKDDRVGLLSNGRSWWPVCDFSIMSAGAWTVPVYPSLPSNQIGFIVRHAGMKGIFVENQNQFEKVLKAHQEEPLPVEFVVVLNPSEFNQALRESAPWPVHLFDDLLDTVGQTEEVQGRIERLSRDDCATIVYTSGTTGVPKGVMLTHGNILSNVEGIRERIELQPTDVHLSYLPLSHVFERTVGHFLLLIVGMQISYATNVDHIVADFERVQPTCFTTVPRLLEKVQERVERQIKETGGIKASLFKQAMKLGLRARVNGEAVSSSALKLYDAFVFNKLKQVMGGRLRILVSGGAPLAPHVGRFFTSIGMPIYEGYGMTETAPVVSFNTPANPRLGTVGQHLSNVECKIAEDGELLVRGQSITPGYYRNETANRETFTEDGWLKTGDIATLSADGYVTITDRKKHLIVLSTGKKVTPAPIENDILQSSLIDQVCLIGQGRKYVAAIVVPNKAEVERWQSASGNTDGTSFKLEHLMMEEIARTTATYAKFEQPKRVLLAEPFTIENDMLTPSLKVKTNRVRQIYAQAIDNLYDTSMPQTDEKTAVGKIPTPSPASDITHST